MSDRSTTIIASTAIKSPPQPPPQATTTPLQQSITPPSGSPRPPASITPSISNPPDVQNPRRDLPLQISSTPTNPQPPPSPPPSHAQTLSLLAPHSSSGTQKAQQETQTLSKTHQAQQALSKIQPGTVAARIRSLVARQQTSSSPSPPTIVCQSSFPSSSTSTTKPRRFESQTPIQTPHPPPGQRTTQQEAEGEEEWRRKPHLQRQKQNQKRNTPSLATSSSRADSVEKIQSDEVGSGVACEGRGAEEGEGEGEVQEQTEGVQREAWVGEGKGWALLRMGSSTGGGVVVIAPNSARSARVMERGLYTKERHTALCCRHGRLRSPALIHTHSIPAAPKARDQTQSPPTSTSTTTTSNPIRSKYLTSDFKFDPLSPWTQVAERTMDDRAFGRAVCQECQFEIEASRVGGPPSSGSGIVDDGSTTTIPRDEKPSDASEQQAHLDRHRLNVDQPILQSHLDSEASDENHDEIEDLTSLIHTLDEIIASHSLKLRNVSEALARELGELNRDSDGDDEDDAPESDSGVGDPCRGRWTTSSAEAISTSQDVPSPATSNCTSTSSSSPLPESKTTKPSARKETKKKKVKPETPAQTQWLVGLRELIGLVDEQLGCWGDGLSRRGWEGRGVKEGGVEGEERQLEEQMGKERRKGSLRWDALAVAGAGIGTGTEVRR